MADQLIQEIDADLRAAQINAWWNRNHKKLVVVAIVLILGTAANSIWQHYAEKRGGELMLSLTSAQALYDQGKFAESAEGFAAAANNASGETRTLAQLWQGRALSAAGKKPEAIAILKTASSARVSLWSDLACLRLAGLDATAATCLGNTQDSPLASQRRAWQAASDWQAGNNAKAITTLEELATSDSVTEQTRAQFTQWLATLRATGKAAE